MILAPFARIFFYMDATTVLGRRFPWAVSERSELDWDAVYAEQLPRVLDFFRYRVGSRADAEDLASLTFEKAWRARHRYRRDRAQAGTWLLAIARNVAIDHYRSRGLRDAAPLEAAEGIAGGETPEEQAVRRSDANRLARLLETLAGRERELVALKYGARLTNREIARVTGLTETNVGSILHRTVKALRARWDQGVPQ